ncbi:hypothetical protein KB1_22770 [Cutibacterium modestum]|uniref:Uncharacterized protein n=1 Tax=Cutibacterium modestum TaxID=2559073 RepID=A0AAD1NVT4_9ACTN|nr:hypothetical protein KB1_22770 [Cutibacterium modestum]
MEPMDTQPGKQDPQAKRPGNSEDDGGPYRGYEKSDHAASSDPEPKCCQQHEGSQRIEASDTEGEGRSEERQHGERLLGSHLTDNTHRLGVALQTKSVDFTSVLSPCYRL